MSKVRVYVLAKKLNIESKELMNILEDLGVKVKSHMSSLEDDIAELVEETIKESIKLQKEPEDEKEDILAYDDIAGKDTVKQKTKKKGLDEEYKETDKSKPSKKQSKRREKTKQDKTGNGMTIIDKKGDTKKSKGTIEIPERISVSELAKVLNESSSEVLKSLLNIGVITNINQDIDYNSAKKVARDLGINVKPQETTDTEEGASRDVSDDPESLKPRPPVVTVMGHVDHGKTTLLDSIRETKVIDEEDGGITQHIGAYQVEINGKKITFIDTPGHEAFTAMRARGARVTDIAILVVSADDGVMPQTVEAINHAKSANVPIIVAINKIDKPNTNVDKLKQELVEQGLVPEDWGGDTVCVPVSALRNEGIDELLEMITLMADMEELKANPDTRARGVIVESKLDIGRGPVATVIIKRGTLQVGDPIVAGNIFGKVRAMFNDKGERVAKGGPSSPVEIIGFSNMPKAGDVFEVLEGDKQARAVADERTEIEREQKLRRRGMSLDNLYERMSQGDVGELNVVIKGDVQGSVEAIRKSLEQLSTDEVKVNVVHVGVGGITESDIMLASASNAIIIGFNVRPDTNARRVAEVEDVDIRLYRIIYDVIEEVKGAMQGLLKPELRERIAGRAEARQLFKVPKAGIIAGCHVTEGNISRNLEVRIIRDNVVVFEGKISSLKRFKEDVREVSSGYECGIGIENFNDIKEGDIIEAFEYEEIERAL